MENINNLENACRCKQEIKDTFDEGIGYITTYLKNALREHGLDGAVRKGNERNTGVLEVEGGSVAFVKKTKNGTSRQYFYTGADWLRFEHQMSPDEIIDKLINVYHFKSADITPAQRLGITPEQLTRVKAYCDSLDISKADELNCLAEFEHNGQSIVNIFLSPCSRFEYDIDKAIEVYGLKNVKGFCELALEKGA